MPPSPFRPIAYSSSPAAIIQEDPLQSTPSPLLSPPVTFYTAPSTPLAETPKDQQPSTPGSPPPLPVLHITIPPQSHSPSTQYPFASISPPNAYLPASHSAPQEPNHVSSVTNIAQEAFPEPPELPADMVFDDEGLSTLEKIYLYSRSKASYHRIFIANVLPEWLEHVTPHEAVEYVLPLLNTLAMDEDEMVKEAFSSRLVNIMWWFLTHCQLTPEDSMNQDDMNPPDFHDHERPPLISVQEFTPILGTLLLSPNIIVGETARYTVVQLLERIRRVDGMDSNRVSSSTMDHSTNLSSTGPTGLDIDPEGELNVGLFGKVERALFEKEILYQVVIGMGRLDAEGDPNANDDTDDSQYYDDALEFQHPDHTAGYTAPDTRENLVIQVAESPEKYDSPGCELQITNHRIEQSEDDKSKLDGSVNPYFPVSPSGYKDKTPGRGTSQGGSPASISSLESNGSTPGSTTGTSASSLDDESLSLPTHYSPRILVSPSSDEASPLSSSLSISSNPVSIESLTSQFSISSNSSNLSQRPYWSDPNPTPHAQPVPLTEFSSMGSQDSLNGLSAPNNDTTQDSQGPLSGQLQRVCGASVFPDGERTHNDEYMEDIGKNDHAAIGRLSSMSLMAAVAASGCLDEATKRAFVKEVERVSQDPIYWVRQEACFALGALAKVVPEELVLLTLMPLLSNVVSDSAYQVRHSSLYALPPILTRLSPRKRRELALDILVPMSMDESPEVRSGVLEALGEVIYTFHSEHLPSDEDDIPPKQLLQMFLGRTEDRRVLNCHQNQSLIEKEWIKGDAISRTAALQAFYEDSTRPLICAFNVPAVALTLGRSRWSSELRETYISLAESNVFGVKRTLAASLGEMAKILGPEYARKDLMGVWRTCVRNEDAEVRMKAAGALEVFFVALDKTGQKELLFDLLVVWEGGLLKGWREREKVAGLLGWIAEAAQGQDLWVLIARMEVLSLLDPFNAVREAGISALQSLWLKFQRSNEAFGVLRTELRILASSDTSRKRMTFIACLQALTQPQPSGEVALTFEDEACPPFETLTNDPILGVRIGLARLMGTTFARHTDSGKPIPQRVLKVVNVLKTDTSDEVKAFVAGLHAEEQLKSPNADSLRSSSSSSSARARSSSVTVSTFSRPPPSSKVVIQQPKIAVSVEA
ncbi:heat repeat family protein [Moniliophthora roreri MCA 2997]|uniref:Heat repeat family protein n=1 Tax=Moniliophthora roreri (strain MCA 2997) TaxID=1381753 RepID=V2XCC9_MONRO|nr:heat repeat family protein [Moniliophthora roreri MCA 2997]